MVEKPLVSVEAEPGQPTLHSEAGTGNMVGASDGNALRAAERAADGKLVAVAVGA